jgi:hypothetical protein
VTLSSLITACRTASATTRCERLRFAKPGFDWARPIDGVKRGPVWRKHGQDADVVLDRTSRPGSAWFSASSFDATIPRAPDDNLVWHDDRQIGYLREVPLALEFYSPREGGTIDTAGPRGAWIDGLASTRHVPPAEPPCCGTIPT